MDTLRIDIEGGEFYALTSFITSHAHGDLPASQLQLEIHALHGRELFEYFIGWWESLQGGRAATLLEGAGFGVHRHARCRTGAYRGVTFNLPCCVN